jgi:hypothetical protein
MRSTLSPFGLLKRVTKSNTFDFVTFLSTESINKVDFVMIFALKIPTKLNAFDFVALFTTERVKKSNAFDFVTLLAIENI